MPRSRFLATMQSMRVSSLCLLAALGSSSVEGRAVKSVEIYSAPMKLKPGEVYNAWQPPIPLPDYLVKRFANKTMHMKSIELDIIHVDAATGEEQSLRLDEVYNHHYALVVGSTDRMAKFYNMTKTEGDPLDGLGAENHHGHGHKSSKGHNHYGCMMSGASVQILMDDINSIPANDQGRLAVFGGVSGAEFRGTPVDLAGDFAFSSAGPEAFMTLVHFINMRGAPSVQEQRFECPCQKHMVIDPENGTVNGVKVKKFNCSTELLRQKNIGCSLESYQGGYRCCENGFFLTEEIPSPETPTDEFFAKFTFSYWDEDEVPEARSVYKTSCCDATGNLTVTGNIEYTVPPCTPGTPPERCVHMITALQPLDMQHTSTGPLPPANPDDLIDLVHAWGHMHVGGINMELYNDETGQLICETRPQYGAGTSPGDEDGYLVAIPPCVWGPPPLPAPPRLRKGTLMRTVARYNNTVGHYGVMSLWLMTAAPVPQDEKTAARDDMFV